MIWQIKYMNNESLLSTILKTVQTAYITSSYETLKYLVPLTKEPSNYRDQKSTKHLLTKVLLNC